MTSETYKSNSVSLKLFRRDRKTRHLKLFTMKKITLVIAAMLIGLTSATASGHDSEFIGKKLEITKRYRFMQPILFVERGVEFLVFPNGEVDFSTKINNTKRRTLFRKNNISRRGSINKSYKTRSRGRVKYSNHKGNRIQYDRSGKVRRVGNVFINYDHFDRVKRVGSVHMKYRHGILNQVGNLSIQYNRHGSMVALKGHINRHNDGCGFCGVTSCSTNHFEDRYA